jgi:hypothetical protein
MIFLIIFLVILVNVHGLNNSLSLNMTTMASNSTSRLANDVKPFPTRALLGQTCGIDSDCRTSCCNAKTLKCSLRTRGQCMNPNLALLREICSKNHDCGSTCCDRTYKICKLPRLGQCMVS